MQFTRLKNLSVDEWNTQHMEISKTLRVMTRVLLITCVFCLITVSGAPDIALLGTGHNVPLPFGAGSVPFSGFLITGPLLLIGLLIYSHVFLAMHNQLETHLPHGYSNLLYRLPYLANSGGRFSRALSYFIFYLLTPITVLVFCARTTSGDQILHSYINIIASLLCLSLLTRLYYFNAKHIHISVFDKSRRIAPLFLLSILAFLFIAQSLEDKIRRPLGAGGAQYAPILEPDFRIHWPIRLNLTEEKTVNFTGADLVRFNFDNSDLSYINLSGANLEGAKLNYAFLAKVNLTSANLSGGDLSGAHLTGADLTGADLSGGDLAGADLTGADLTGADLTEADLTGAVLNGADLTGTDLTEADLTGAVLERTNLYRTNFLRANLTDTHLYGANLSGANLYNVDLTEANFVPPDIIETIFYVIKGDLIHANLSGAVLTSAKLSRAILPEADLTGAKLINADLTGALLYEADLAGAVLNGADLTGAHLTGADLTGALLYVADLSGAYLTGADLTGADLIEADLTGADLTDADLTGADLTGAELSGVNISRAIGTSRTKLPDGITYPNNWLIKDEIKERDACKPPHFWRPYLSGENRCQP